MSLYLEPFFGDGMRAISVYTQNWAIFMLGLVEN